VKAGSYLSGTATDEALLARVPDSVRVIRSGALRGFSRLGSLLQPLKNALRGTGNTQSAPASSSTSAPSPSSPGLKTLVEELCAMPDKDVGWLAPAITRALPALSTSRPDVIFSSAPPWTTHLVAGTLASALGRPWVADFRDPWVRSPWTRYQTSVAKAVARRLEAAVVRRAAAVVFTTESARREFERFYGDDAGRRFHVVYNGCDPADVRPMDPRSDDGQFVLLHAGTLYGGRSPEPLIRAVASVRAQHEQGRRLRLRFLGSTGFPGVDLEGLCRSLGLQEVVEFLPRVDRAASLREMQRASALVILQGGTAMAIPGKLYEYLAVGRPVLALAEPGEMTSLITANRIGVVATPNDWSDIERALVGLLNAGPGSWSTAAPALFDGSLRAAELGEILSQVIGVPGASTCAA
jgi:glycosyltransferase involved in cell wall biosynthesis